MSPTPAEPDDCADCGKPLPANGGYSRMGESARCARCFRKSYGKSVPLTTLKQWKAGIRRNETL